MPAQKPKLPIGTLRANDKIDAYIWVKGLTKDKANALMDLRPPEFKNIRGERAAMPTGRKAFIRNAMSLIGQYDGIVCISADNKNEIDNLVFGTLHAGPHDLTTETNVAIWPAAGGRVTAGTKTPPPPPPPTGPNWRQLSKAIGVYGLKVDQTQLQGVWNAINDSATFGQTFQGASILGSGQYQMIVMLGASTWLPVLNASRKFNDIVGIRDITSHLTTPGP
ncbi:MAG TPA: hypothetical protein VGA30_02465 [Actinomycetota bacterium]